MTPAQQRLAACDGLGLGVDLRLIVEFEFLVCDRAPQIELQQTSLLNARVHRQFEEAIGVAALRFGPVHRHVGVLQQGIRVLPVAGADRDADADPDIGLAPVQIERLGDRLDKAPRQAAGLLRLLQVSLQHDEFIAAEAGERVGLAQALPQARDRLLEEEVADRMAMEVVDGFEIVEIEIMKAEHFPAARTRQRFADAVEQQGPIRQSRQGVVGTQIADLLFGPHRLGDVLVHRDIAAAAHRIMGYPHRAAVLQRNLFGSSARRRRPLASTRLEIDRHFARSAALRGAIVENALQSRAGNRQLSGQRIKLRHRRRCTG